MKFYKNLNYNGLKLNKKGEMHPTEKLVVLLLVIIFVIAIIAIFVKLLNSGLGLS